MKRHSIEGLTWYSQGNICVFPFTRSRMNLVTLGQYGRSARTKPLVSCRMWGVGYLAENGLPFGWDESLKSFRAPDYTLAYDKKAEAVKRAWELGSFIQ